MKVSERSLLQRQSLLLSRSERLRMQWRDDAAAFAPTLGKVDVVLDAGRWLGRHPEWPAGMLLLAVAVRPRRLWRWGWRVVLAWRSWQRVRPLALPWLRAARRAWNG